MKIKISSIVLMIIAGLTGLVSWSISDPTGVLLAILIMQYATMFNGK